ncbi:MAG: oligosaccharide flippase family protein [Jannaschia sp.]
MLRSALLLLSGNTATAALLFARNIAVASLIPVADYGVAATFALAMAAVEMASAFGLQQQIVQARDGDAPRLQQALQGFQLLRGVIAALALLAVAGPLARFLGIAEAAWAYQVLALVPLCKALEHFDIHRLNRNRRFGPLVLTGTVPALGALLLVWPLAAWLGDWRVMLWAIVFQGITAAALSHLVAERPYRVLFDRVLWGRSLRFGWPILLNAALLFGVFQGDKIIVARVMGMEVLGVFAMAVTLTLTPSMVLAKTVQTSWLPRLSSAEGPDFTALASRAMILSLMLGAAIAALGVLIAPVLAAPLAGTGFATLPVLLVPLAILHGLRITKAGVGVAALSLGFTENAAISNLPRLLALIAGGWMLARGAPLLTLIWLGCVGESAGFVLSAMMLRLRAGQSVRPPWPAIALAATAFAAATAAATATLSASAALAISAAAILGLAILLARPPRTGDNTA